MNLDGIGFALALKTLALVGCISSYDAPSFIGTSTTADAYTTCPGEVASPSTTFSTSITFMNSSTIPVDVYWIDFVGQRKLYRTLQPRERYTQQTYYQHVWAVTSSAGDCIRTAAATAGSSVVEVK